MFPIVRDEREDFGGDVIDRCGSVLHGEKQVEHVQRIPFQGGDLKTRFRVSSMDAPSVGVLHLCLVQSCHNSVGITLELLRGS